MFTGLIEHLGTVSNILTEAGGCTLTIADSGAILDDCHIGDSIAVNGACLTVVEFDQKEHGGWFTVWLANETLDRTDLGELKVNDQVNLERAMGAHVRFGGHFVQAHVDGTANIVERIPDGDSLRITFQLPESTPDRPSLLPYIIPKGYITIDGTSLTITGVKDSERRFSVMLIKHTQEMITLSKKAVGAKVNIEVDMVGKYVRKSVVAALGGEDSDDGIRGLIEKVVEDVLAKRGQHKLRPTVNPNAYLLHHQGVINSLNAMNTTGKKITVKASTTFASSRPPSRTNSPRPPSPIKFSESSGSTTSTTFRPKAKVNTSATVRKAPSVVSSSTVSPRAGSPTKLVRAQNGNLSPTFQPRVATANVTIRRPQTPVSAPGTPEVRSRHIAISDVGTRGTGRARDGSVSQLHHAISFSSLEKERNAANNSSPPIRVRSKVTGINRAANETTSPSPQPVARLRSTSSSANLSQVQASSPPMQFYPITTSSPAANPHRYGQMRPTPAPSHLTYMAPAPNPTDTQSNRQRINGPARVDISSIPPTPVSPPASTLSYSSRSSVSQPSPSVSDNLSPSSLADQRRGSNATELFSPTVGHQKHGSLNGSDVDEDMSDHSTSPKNEERQVKANAKSQRKIADLEITNRSLLSINLSLEATKNKQAKEIRELRRKLRESRLVLPPTAFQIAKASWGPEELPQEDEDSDEDSELEEATQGDGDEIYKRVKLMIDGLITAGRDALEAKVEDFSEGVAKVLTAEEVQSWHRSNETGDQDIEEHSDLESVSQADTSFASTFNDDDDDVEFSDHEPSHVGGPLLLDKSPPPIRISDFR
ncbi:hypothetical protein FA15DRAFT_759695 [Coprinopsis marcescibilis]|uniref:Riboflavin synthase n=1 Tax=Coprinopsis marcescibilis TaxID=230819 RepID=A0A5C3KIH9_COPMA|nr:hypothetical protein FA15DRAFT_759695 [Coprinopsis marcescibilis]